jgi:uroporphyrinogen decarboxylase
MSNLSPRERVKLALAHQEPDKLPIDLGPGRQTSIYSEPYLQVAECLGLGKVELALSPRDVLDGYDERVLQALDIDFRRVSLRDVPEDKFLEPSGLLRDVWGIGWRRTGAFCSPFEHPLIDATIDDLHKYPWPDPADDRRFKGVREEAEFLHNKTGYAVVAKEPSHIYGILAQSIYMRGMENFFCDLALNKEFAHVLMQKVLDYHLNLYGRFLAEVGDFIDIIHTSDDLGTQTAPYFSPAMYREMIKPRQKQLFGHLKETGAKVLYHSDGAIAMLIDDLIEIGADILNPIEAAVTGMEPAVLKQSFGDRLCFHGGISQQQVLSKGSPADVRAEVRQRIQEMGRGGGYILAAAQTIVPEVPGRNVVEMFRAAREHGAYPIRG